MNLIHSPTWVFSLPCQNLVPSLQHNSTFRDKLHLDCRDQRRKADFCQGKQGAAGQDKMTLLLELQGIIPLFMWL